ncbi:MAG TPA: chaperone modulator CbpM [Acetobacteraceae bacterium]
MRTEAVIALLGDLQPTELVSWVERGWVQPDADGTLWEFREIDVARVRLIRELRHDMALSEDAMPVVLSLLDQVYDLRGVLRRIAGALEGQPAEVRAAVLGAL